MDSSRFVRPFATLGLGDIAVVGGKNASLGELYRELTPLGVAVPNGFAVTADGYRHTLERAGAWAPLREALRGIDTEDRSDLASRAAQARRIVYEAGLPDDVRDAIRAGYAELEREYGEGVHVAVRSSATAEDLPTASFAGQHDTYLNVSGSEALLEACRNCYASLFTDRAIHYRAANGFDHFEVALSAGVMKMVRADLGASGVIFTIDPESGFRDVVVVNAAYGLGENIVQGALNPDEFTVFKPTFEAGHRCVLRRRLGEKALRMVYASDGTSTTTRNVPTSEAERERFCISDADVLQLVDAALEIDRHYSRAAGVDTPMDIEWARDGETGELFILQARPETVVSRKSRALIETFELKGSGPTLVEGRAVGTQIAAGNARIIARPEDVAELKPGEILVADSTSPDWGPILGQAGAIVTNRGGRTCHAAIVARERGIPAVVGTGRATEAIRTGDPVTVSCAEGETGRVHAGTIPFEVHRTELLNLPRPRTKLMLNLANPDIAFASSFLPNDGVGLARMEFIINQSIGIHPMALVDPERVADADERAEIEARTRHYDDAADFFVERLSEGIGTIAAAFYPKPVVVRLSDFKTNEYAALLGGRAFEPEEANPMLGFRGASRYAHPQYAAGFALECAALRRVREEMGLVNVRVMVPFCRRVEEARRVLEEMKKHGLARGENGLEIYVMCEIPNNVILADAFAEHFDGFSIGSNDLTQLTLGVDRDSEVVAFDFDERDPGVLEMIRLAIEGCRRNGRHSGICGQAPSDYPEVTDFLVEHGIDSISLNPDSVVETTRRVLELEAKRSRGAHERSA